MIYDCKVLSTIQCIKYEKQNDQFTTDSKGNDVRNSPRRDSEESKIECARRHFKAISDNGYIYDVAKDYKSLYDIVTK
jgi:type III restriction enzyme